MIVFDSSTLIFLAKIEMLELFISNYKRRLLIPEMVRAEVCVKGKEETPLITRLIAENKIEVVKIGYGGAGKKLMDDFNIEVGEAEALLLAVQEGAEAIATDDRNAIRASKFLKLEFITATTILIRAFEKGFIDKSGAVIKLQKLQSVGRYSKAIIDDAMRQIKEG
ncbi:MAG: hypothetical protein HY786_05650 [Deltaproteobacteria bacterium]|nr:hypothetical protein [Deltaproteobacteria bacterium]